MTQLTIAELTAIRNSISAIIERLCSIGVYSDVRWYQELDNKLARMIKEQEKKNDTK